MKEESSVEFEVEFIPLFSLWWLWIVSACGYILIDVLLLKVLSPWFLNIFYKSKYFKGQYNTSVLPGHTVAVLTERIFIAMMAVLMACTGIVIVYQTSSDVIRARSSILLPSAYVFTFNFFHDLYRMFRTFKLSRLHYRDVSTFFLIFKMIRNRFSFVLHHVLLFTVGLVVAHHSMRRGLGDYFFGCAYLMEFTNPFVSVHFILKELMLEDSFLYKLNGLTTIGVHFITRILMFPFMYHSYASQYHHGNWWAAVVEMRLICHSINGLGLMFQMYWFVKMIKLFLTGAKSVIYHKKVT